MSSLWKNDAKHAVLRAALIHGLRDETSVLIHPRKKSKGWIWVVWGNLSVVEHGEDAMIEEGTIPDMPLYDAIPIAIGHLTRLAEKPNG